MIDSKTAFAEAIRNFPRWMDIRKRPFKSAGGRYLRSVVEELDEVQRALIDYKRDFFILYYVGREHTVIDYLYLAQVGELPEDFALLRPAIQVVRSAKAFAAADSPTALWQSGNLMLRPQDAAQEQMILYKTKGYTYQAKLEKYHVWNVIDEFALFAGLKRYPDELNAALLKRCLLSFQNMTNSAEVGLKHAIINAVSGETAVSHDEILIKRPDREILCLPDEAYDTVYERLAQFNADVFRTKRWDMNLWEHSFRQLMYLPHKWDVIPAAYQDGVGQNAALEAMLTGGIKDQQRTDVSVTGYQQSEIMIEEYIRNQHIEQNLRLRLTRCDNALKPVDIEYKITASDAAEIPADQIRLESFAQCSGEGEHYLADLALEVRGATVVERNQLEPNTEYKLRFFPKDAYADMKIERAILEMGGVKQDLLAETSVYQKIDNMLQNTEVKLHAVSIRDLKTAENIVNTKDGMTLEDTAARGRITVDVTGMDGKLLQIGQSCRKVDITRNPAFVNTEGFVLDGEGALTAGGADSASRIVIELDCNAISWELAAASRPELQGSCTVVMQVNGKIDAEISGLWPSPRSVERTFTQLSHVKIEIQKTGMHPVTIRNIEAARYDFKVWMEKGALVTTPFATFLPVLGTGEKNTLFIEMQAYSAFAPIIQYVHIGASLKNAVYTAKPFRTGAETSKLDVISNCIAKLYKIVAGRETLAADPLITKPTYRNDTNQPAVILIDMSQFQTILQSMPVIEKTIEGGKDVYYITLQPGQQMDRIAIEGESLILLSSATLRELLCKESGFEKVYVSRALKGFIVCNESSGEEKLVHLLRGDLSGRADVFRLRNLPETITGSFLVDRDRVEILDQTLAGGFEEVCLYPLESKEYVAYNKFKALRASTRGVQIVDTFLPLLPSGRLMVYSIAPIEHPELAASAMFEKASSAGAEYATWSLGRKSQGIRVEVTLDYASGSNYEIDIRQMDERFAISNSIALEDIYEIEGQRTELACYRIEPPAHMRVTYATKTYSEEIIAENDGFTKLYYSNVDSIDRITSGGRLISPDRYMLLGPEGILVWQGDSLFGARLQVFYSYKKPRLLSYTSLEYLYSLVGYSVDAYKAINKEPILLKNLTDGDAIAVDFGLTEGYPDRVVTHCSNPNFQAKIENGNLLKVAHVRTENMVAVKSGYFYQNGTEYYHFNQRHIESIDRMSNLKLHNVRRIGDTFVFMQQSTNFLPESSMKAGRLSELCAIDFVGNRKIKGLSRIGALSACDCYNLWIDFDMAVTLVGGYNGMALQFTAGSEEAYAVMEITRHLRPNTLFTCICAGSLQARIAKEVKFNGISYDKSLFIKPTAMIEERDGYRFFVFEEIEPSTRYFLLLTGSGTIDDVIMKEHVPGEKLEEVHAKNLRLLGFPVSEAPEETRLHEFFFDWNGNRLTDLELDKSGLLQTGTNVDWGLTKIYEIGDDWNGCVVKDLKRGKEAVYAQEKTGVLITPPIYLRNRGAIRSLIVKVNSVALKKLTGFRILVFASAARDGVYREVALEDNANILQVLSGRLDQYVKVHVELPPAHVATSVELFAQYAQIGPLRITQASRGELITKIYDAGYMGTFTPRRIDAEAVERSDKLRVWLRACREDAAHIVWTNWKQLQLDASLSVIGDPPVFDRYRYFQFRIALEDRAARLAIRRLLFEVTAHV